MSQEGKDALGIATLPGNLSEAIDEFEANPIAKETLGDHIFTKYIEGKRGEWDSYRTAVTEWELDSYLDLY